MITLIWTIGLVLVLEGLVFALAPSFVEDMLRVLREFSHTQRRLIGALVLTLGLILLIVANIFS